MAVGNDYVQHVIREWAENLWLLNNPAADAAQSRYDALQPHQDEMVAANAVTRAQSLSEQGFVVLCYGMAYGGSVAPKAMDKISKNSLVDAWRSSVTRNRFQKRYDIFEDLLKQTIDRFGMDAAIAQFPASSVKHAADIAEGLEQVKYASRALTLGHVAGMVRLAGARSAASANKKDGPKV